MTPASYTTSVDFTDIFDLRQIDRAQGCLVVVRPDQYVADVLPLDDTERLARQFLGILAKRDARGEAPAPNPGAAVL